MESELEDEMSGQEYLDKIRENYISFMEDNSREKTDLVINRNDGGAKKREEEAEMNMLRRRRERLIMRRRRQTAKKKKKKKKKKKEEESFSSSDSDEETLEEVRRLMENMNSTLKSREEFINTNSSGDAVKIEDSKAEEEMNIPDDNENMFPRTRGRLLRYLRRLRSKPQDSSFQIEFHHLQLPSDNE